MKARFRSRAFVLVLATVALLAIGATVVVASHDFSDVPNTSDFHSAVSYIVDRGVTAGCGAGKYCPKNTVTREQMAAFLKNSMNAVSPKYLIVDDDLGTVDFDGDVQVCTTADHTPSYPQVARVDSWFSGTATGAATFYVRQYYSTNGGTTWTNLDPDAVSRDTIVASGDWGHANNSATLNLTAGTSYRFAVTAGRISGTADASDARCEVLVEISNRNA